MKRLSAPTYAQLYYTSASSVPAAKRKLVAANFLSLLRRQRAMKLMPRIMAHLEKLDDQKHKRTRVVIMTTQDSISKTLENQLTKALGPVVFDLNVDPTLIGGIVLRVGDDAIDGSLRTRLRNLHHHLTNEIHA